MTRLDPAARPSADEVARRLWSGLRDEPRATPLRSGVHGAIAALSAVAVGVAAVFVLLFLLRGAETALSPHQLAERAGVTRATITGLLDGLEREHLVSRHSDPDDKRRIHVRLTRAGQALAARLFDQQTAWIASLFADISPRERRTLGTLLQRVWSRTDAVRAA